MDSRIRFGNAGMDGADHRGWFVGHFMAGPDDLRFTDAVEVKWGVHQPGEGKPHWASNSNATTLSMLIKGRFRITFPNEEILLAQEGDYVIWAPGVPHTWAAEQDSVILTIRWPSQPGDSVVVADGTSTSAIPGGEENEPPTGMDMLTKPQNGAMTRSYGEMLLVSKRDRSSLGPRPAWERQTA